MWDAGLCGQRLWVQPPPDARSLKIKLASFEAIVDALNGAQVRFIVVGGAAVNALGYLRTIRLDSGFDRNETGG